MIEVTIIISAFDLCDVHVCIHVPSCSAKTFALTKWNILCIGGRTSAAVRVRHGAWPSLFVVILYYAVTKVDAFLKSLHACLAVVPCR